MAPFKEFFLEENGILITIPIKLTNLKEKLNKIKFIMLIAKDFQLKNKSLDQNEGE